MKKNLDPNKLLVGIKEFKNTKNDSLNLDSIVSKIHKPDADENKNESVNADSKRTSIDIPKELHKKLKLKIVDKDITIKDYLLELLKKDLEITSN